MNNLYGYDVLIEKFVNGEMSVEKFERLYIDTFLEGDEPLSEKLFLQLDFLFAEVDAYTDDKEAVRDEPENFINEDQLRAAAQKVLDTIRAMK